MKSPVPGHSRAGGVTTANLASGGQTRLLAGFVEPPVDVTNHVRRVPMALDRVFEPPAGVPETLRRRIFPRRAPARAARPGRCSPAGPARGPRATDGPGARTWSSRPAWPARCHPRRWPAPTTPDGVGRRPRRTPAVAGREYRLVRRWSSTFADSWIRIWLVTQVTILAPANTLGAALSRSVKTLTGGRLEADHRRHRIEVPRVPPAPATARTNVGNCRPHHHMPAAPPPINPLSALQALLVTGSDAGGGDNFLVRESGSRTAISVNTGLGVRPASRANCAASGSVGSHVTHPQPVEHRHPGRRGPAGEEAGPPRETLLARSGRPGSTRPDPAVPSRRSCNVPVGSPSRPRTA